MGAMTSVEPEYGWPRPPAGGYTAEDLDRLPGLPPHTELIDGSLVFVSPQTVFHMRTPRLLENRLLDVVPPELDVVREMTVTLGRRDRPEPELMVVRAESVWSGSATGCLPEDVRLAVEVVSADSEARDRNTKPHKYAAAGIPHFWRVEREEADDDRDRPVVYVFELEPVTRAYAVTGIHHDHLKLSVPFPLEIDLTARR